MIAKVIKWLTSGITPIQIDGTLYMLIAAFGSIQTFFTSDDAYKYVDPYILFWIKCLTGIALAVAGALKMFRSTAYSEHLKNNPTPPENKTP